MPSFICTSLTMVPSRFTVTLYPNWAWVPGSMSPVQRTAPPQRVISPAEAERLPPTKLTPEGMASVTAAEATMPVLRSVTT